MATKCVQQNMQQGNILIHIIIGVFDEIDVLEIRSEICAAGPGRHKSRILSPIRAAGPDRRLTTACTFSSLPLSIGRIGAAIKSAVFADVVKAGFKYLSW